MATIDWAAVVAAFAVLISALAYATPKIVDTFQRFGEASRQTAKSHNTSAETVRGIADAMRSTLETRLKRTEDKLDDQVVVLARVQTRNDECEQENRDMLEKIKILEAARSEQQEVNLKLGRALAQARVEREQIQKDLEMGSGSKNRALPAPFRPQHVDETGHHKTKK